MRDTAIISVSLPPKLAAASDRLARKRHMTRSELLRAALRHYLEELGLEQALRVADDEQRTGKIKTLRPGGLARLMSST